MQTSKSKSADSNQIGRLHPELVIKLESASLFLAPDIFQQSNQGEGW